MGSPVEVKAAAKCHPSAAADPTGSKGVFRYAVDGTSQSFAIPQTWKGCNVWVRADGGTGVQYATSVGGPAALAINQLAPVGTGHASAGLPLSDGETGDALIGSAETHMNWRGVSGAGYIVFFKSEKPVL